MSKLEGTHCNYPKTETREWTIVDDHTIRHRSGALVRCCRPHIKLTDQESELLAADYSLRPNA